MRSGATARSATVPCGVCGFLSSRRTLGKLKWLFSKYGPRAVLLGGKNIAVLVVLTNKSTPTNQMHMHKALVGTATRFGLSMRCQGESGTNRMTQPQQNQLFTLPTRSDLAKSLVFVLFFNSCGNTSPPSNIGPGWDVAQWKEGKAARYRDLSSKL